MSGETELEPSGWTPDLLKQHFDRTLADRDLRFQQRFEASEHQLNVVPPVAEQVSKLAVRVDGFQDLMDAKFITYRVMIESQADKVALALTSADKAQEARDAYMREALDARDKLINTLTDRVRELELARSSTGGEHAGGQAKVSDQRAVIGLVIIIATLLLGIIVFAASLLTRGPG